MYVLHANLLLRYFLFSGGHIVSVDLCRQSTNQQALYCKNTFCYNQNSTTPAYLEIKAYTGNIYDQTLLLEFHANKMMIYIARDLFSGYGILGQTK